MIPSWDMAFHQLARPVQYPHCTPCFSGIRCTIVAPTRFFARRCTVGEMNVSKKIHFTKSSIAAIAIPAKGRTYTYDLNMPGLALCVTDRGARTFYWSGRLAGQPTRIRIGQYPEVSIKTARDEAMKIGGQKAMGHDAVNTRQSIRKEKRIGELWDTYLQQHSKPHKRTSNRDEKTWERDLSRWQKRRLSSLSTEEVSDLTTTLYSTRGPGAANKALNLIRAMYGYARHPLGWTTHEPSAGMKLYKIESRERYLLESELVAFFTALADLQQKSKDFILLCLLTGARRANVMAMRRDEIDFDQATWRIPSAKYKGKIAATIALVPAALDIIKGRLTDSPWIFPGSGQTGHYVEPKHSWKTLLTKAKLEDLRIHDLRRTLGSWQALGGASLQVIGKSLGHKSLSSTEVYARLQLDPVRLSMQKATDAIFAAGQNKKT